MFHKDETYKCEFCDKIFNSFSSRKKHITYKHGKTSPERNSSEKSTKKTSKKSFKKSIKKSPQKTPEKSPINSTENVKNLDDDDLGGLLEEIKSPPEVIEIKPELPKLNLNELRKKFKYVCIVCSFGCKTSSELWCHLAAKKRELKIFKKEKFLMDFFFQIYKVINLI